MDQTLKTNPVLASIQRLWHDQPLSVIMALAILFRLLAAIFAKGWGMLDDHYLVIEAPQSWVYGYDYNDWLPGSRNNTGPSGHNFFYPGLHYLLFMGIKWAHLNDPQVKMLIVRMMHGAFSLITVWCGYRIAETLEGRKSARLAGLLLAICFFMPWVSVRNLVEAASIPFVMLGFWRIIRARQEPGTFLTGLVAGIFFGLAADIRYQLVLYPAGVAAVLLLRRQWKETAGLASGVFCSFLVVQAVIDMFLWGYPFAEFLGYIGVNVTDRNSYFNLPWYNYFLTVGGFLIPPVSLFLFYGFFRGWKRYLILFFPAALFFAFHSAFPNKQERFILPFLPVFIVAGVMGYYRYMVPASFVIRNHKLVQGSWIFFWVINTLLLTGLTFMYSKRSQVESMYYLSRYPYLKTIIIEDENGGVPLAPLFYTGQWPEYPELHPPDTVIAQKAARIASGPKFRHPQFYLFTGSRNLGRRITVARRSFPGLVYETTIEPGFVDQLMHRLNPVNKANKVYIFRNREFYKTGME